MLRKLPGRSQAPVRILTAALAALLLLPAGTVRAQAAPAESRTAPAPQSGIRGKVVRADGLPVRGAVVHASSLQTGEEIVSTPTDHRGEFEISGMPHGYYDLAVETDEGLFAGNRVVNVPPAGFGVIELRVAATTTDVDNSAYGNRAVGRATVERKLNRREFWRSPKGVGLLAGIGGAGLLALAAGGGSNRRETPASPF